MSEAFYTREAGSRGRERLFASELTRGPWSNAHQHGGPPSALLARAIEAVPSDGPVLVTRLTIELLRPIAIAAPLEIDTEVMVAGRKVQRIAAVLRAGDEQLAVALAMRMRVREQALTATAPDEAQAGYGPLRPLADCRSFTFDFFRHSVGYHTALEARLSAGEFGHGCLDVWMRPRVPLVAGEESTPLQRVMICADAGHGLGSALDPAAWSFPNPDLSVHLHRLPSDPWLGMQARTFSQPLGVGLCRTRLSDRSGDLGMVLQSQLIAARR